MKNKYFVYVITNLQRTTFYVGITNDLSKRIYVHKMGWLEGFSKKYKLKYLIYFEELDGAEEALKREKQLKNWHRDWKINLIKKVNPELKEISILS